MPCISIALHCSCAELPPVICCPNVFLPYGWDLPSSSLPPHLHTHSSLPASHSFSPSCTVAMIITMQVMSCNVTEAGQIKGPHSPTADQLLAPVPGCACVLRPTQDNFEGVARGASPLVTLRLFQTMSTHPLCNVFGLFLTFGGGYFLLSDLATTKMLVKTIHKLSHDVDFKLWMYEYFEWWIIC